MSDINTIFINGVDSTELFKKRELPNTPDYRYGPNGGMMQSGRQIVDVLAVKDSRSRAYQPLTEAQLRTHLTNLRQDRAYITVSVYDEATGGMRSYEASYKEPQRRYRLTDASGVRWFTLSDLQFTEC